MCIYVCVWTRPGRGTRPRRFNPRGARPLEWVLMHWLILIISGLFEAVWATALGRSEGLTRLTPTLVFIGGLVLSMVGLAYAMRELPTGTAYAVWVGVGATVTVLYAMATGTEPVSLLKVLFLLMIVAGIVGLKVTS